MPRRAGHSMIRHSGNFVIGITCILVVAWSSASAQTAFAQVFSSEFFSDPVSEGWDLAACYCDPETWTDEGWFHQQLDHEACPPGPEGAAVVYSRSLQPLNGAVTFFTEFRLVTDGDRSGIPYGAPTLLAFGNNAGVHFHMTVAADLVQFLRDIDLPIWLIEIEPGVPHTYRVELYPDRYAFFIDAYLIDAGVPEGPFPAYDSRITWRGRSWYFPCHNAWDYIRYGVIPLDGSGDYDGDGAETLFDLYFLDDCLAKDGPGIFGGPGNDAGPGCRFADFDADGDVDLSDFAAFQNSYGV